MHLQQTRVRSPHSTAPEPRDTKNISRYMIALGPDGPATTIAPMRSLAQVFKLPNDSKQFTNRIKSRLCFNLALSFFYLSSKHWQTVRWCSGSDLEPQIYFSRDPATGDLANITEALVSCHLDNEELSQEELELNGDMQLLHLAKVLMEVQLQEKICLKHGPKRMSLEKFRIKLVELAASTPYFTHRDNDFRYAIYSCLGTEGKDIRLNGYKAFLSFVMEKIIEPLRAWAGVPCVAAEKLEEVVIWPSLGKSRCTDRIQRKKIVNSRYGQPLYYKSFARNLEANRSIEKR